METNEMADKFRNIVRNAIQTPDMDEDEIDEIDEIIDEVYAQLNITPDTIAEQIKQGEANGISANQQINILNLLVMKAKNGI